MSEQPSPLYNPKDTSMKATPIYPQQVSLSDFTPESQLIISCYQCPLCDGITYNPVLDVCGHFFCEGCFTLYTSQYDICPVDKQTKISGSKPGRVWVISDLLNQQTVLCKNKTRECPWRGLLKEMKEHLNEHCLKQTVNCRNKDCNESIARETLADHAKVCEYRIEPCEDCKCEFPFNQLKSHHGGCPKAAITCTQGCDESIPREELTKHIEDKCLFTLISCPFADLGCEVKLIRKEMNHHIETQLMKHNLNVFEVVRQIEKDYKEMFDVFCTRMKKLETPGLYKPNPNHYPESDFESFDRPTPSQEPVYQLIQINNQITSDLSSISPNKAATRASASASLIAAQLKKANVKALPPHFYQRGFKVPKKDPIDLLLERDKEKDIKSGLRIDTSSLLSGGEDEEDNAEEDEKEGKRSVFDSKHIPSGVCISENIARCLNNPRCEHRYVFLNKTFKDTDKDSTYDWMVAINPSSFWIGMGLCNKEEVLKNNGKFFSSQSDFNHHTYCLSINGYLWNCANAAENNLLLPDFPKVSKGDQFYFTYKRQDKVLEFRLNGKGYGRITEVYAKALTPCILFLHNNDEVQVFFK